MPTYTRGSFEWAMFEAEDEEYENFGPAYGVRRVAWKAERPYAIVPKSFCYLLSDLCQEDREAIDWEPVYYQ